MTEKGIQEYEVTHFRKSKEIRNKNTNFNKIIKFMFDKKVDIDVLPIKEMKQKCYSSGIYICFVLLKLVILVIKLIIFIFIYLCFSLGIITLLNSELRNILFKLL